MSIGRARIEHHQHDENDSVNEGMVVVTCSDNSDDIVGGCTWGDRSVDLAAPSNPLVRLTPGGGSISTAASSSFAGPQVSGTIGLMRAVNPTASAQDLIGFLRQSVKTHEDLFSLANSPTTSEATSDAERLLVSIVPAYFGITDPVIGDANWDQIFDSSDWTFTFQTGEYDDGDNDNSGFAEGDCNGDGDFDELDLDFAQLFGVYVV